MADDLMDFSEAESRENSLVAEQDENDNSRVPGLLQSPVIVNSILKQSTKDNLIQLYTPVQKPEKGRLKVHFGHDSLLQTPNVNQIKKKMDEIMPIEEEVENITKASGVKFSVEDKENVAQDPRHTNMTNVTKKVDSDADGVEVAKHIVSEVIDQIEIKDDVDSDRNCADSCLEMSAMEVSVCEAQTSEKAVDPTEDILLQAEMLLRSLQGDVADSTKTAPVESSEQSQAANQGVEKDGSEKKAEEKRLTEKNKDVLETSSEKGQKSEIVSVSINQEEPMECEEAMEVDEEDDEIVFNIGKNRTEEKRSPVVIGENVVAQVDKTVEKENTSEEIVNEVSSESKVETVESYCKDTDDSKVETVESNCKDTDDSKVETVESICKDTDDSKVETVESNCKNTDDSKVETVESICKDTDDTKVETVESNCKDSDDSPSLKNDDVKTDPNLLKNVENDAKDEVSDKEEKKLNKDKCVIESEKASELLDKTAADVQEFAAGVKDKRSDMIKRRVADSDKTGDDSSDEEFMSADEDMEVDEVKTPAKASVIDSDFQQDSNTEPKQVSPERTPPKMGYNLNFDDIDSMDPFAIKKSLVNSPDVGKQTKQEVKMDGDNKEKVSDLSVDINDLASKKVDDKVDKNEIHVNTSPEKCEPLKAEVILSPNAALVDEVCRDKTAGDIFKERPDCLLPDDINQINDPESLVQQENSIPKLNGLESDAKKEIDFDSMDPFKPKAQIVNTPDKVKQEGATSSNIEDPFKASHQIMNTPDKSEVKDNCKDSQIEPFSTVNTVEDDNIQKQTMEQQKIDNNIPVTPEKEVIGERVLEASPAIPLSKGTYNLDALELGDIDPFKPAKQMTNSPTVASGSNTSDKADPFKPKMQIQNSPVASKSKNETKPEESDPFKPRTQIINSPISKKEVSEVTENNIGDADQDKTCDDVTDPFIPKSQIKNSPSKQMENVCGEENDPFKPNTQIQNSPASKVMNENVNTINVDNLGDIDPFKPKSQIQNSPGGKVDDVNRLDLENLDSIDPIKSKSQLQNSPPGKITEVESDLETVDDPFKPRNQVEISPLIKEPKTGINGTEPRKTDVAGINEDSTEKNIDPVADVDSFSSRKQLQMSPLAKSENKIDPFADLNPFETKTKVVNTPEKAEKLNENQSLDDIGNMDPFKSKSKVANSPELKTIEENLFESKSRVANTPTKQDDPFSQKVELPTTPKESEEPLDELGDIFEVQGVTRRGQELSQSDKFGDIDDTQFVSASQVFNDPAAWEMLEKLGNATSNTAESALSRMSLYVKFDPLVDEAPAVNPRRISIRVSQLEKVKEYGLDETLLLLGTPPKKRRQSMTASQARATPIGSKSASAAVASQPDKKTDSVAPGAVDLILAYSPKEKEQEKGGTTADSPVMALLDHVDSLEESENLFQELKYTDVDLKRIQRDNKLAMQGMLINKDKEWCKKEKQWEQKYSELSKKCKQIKADRDKLEQAFLNLEETVYQIAAARDASEKKVEELKNEKEQALQDIQAVETAFSDLHRRYEKAKTMIMSMKKNEETLKKHAADSQEKQKKMNEKFHTFEKSSQEKLSANKTEIEKLEQQRDSVQSKFDAQVKIMQMKIENLETSLQRKTEENKQLTEICDNLLAKVGQ